MLFLFSLLCLQIICIFGPEGNLWWSGYQTKTNLSQWHYSCLRLRKEKFVISEVIQLQIIISTKLLFKLIRITNARNPPAVSQYANFVLWILNADFVVKIIFGSITRAVFLQCQLWTVNYYVKSCQIISVRDHSSITSACFWLF